MSPSLDGARTVEGMSTTEPERTLADLVRQLEVIRRDAGVIQDRLARLAALGRFRTLSHSEHALHAEWRAAVRQLTAEVHALERLIRALT